MEQLVKALAVMVLDGSIRSFLEANDPQALKQALKALRDAGFKCPDGYPDPDAFWRIRALNETV